jgi:hypothetical protein
MATLLAFDGGVNLENPIFCAYSLKTPSYCTGIAAIKPSQAQVSWEQSTNDCGAAWAPPGEKNHKS